MKLMEQQMLSRHELDESHGEVEVTASRTQPIMADVPDSRLASEYCASATSFATRSQRLVRLLDYACARTDTTSSSTEWHRRAVAGSSVQKMIGETPALLRKFRRMWCGVIYLRNQQPRTSSWSIAWRLGRRPGRAVSQRHIELTSESESSADISADPFADDAEVAVEADALRRVGVSIPRLYHLDEFFKVLRSTPSPGGSGRTATACPGQHDDENPSFLEQPTRSRSTSFDYVIFGSHAKASCRSTTTPPGTVDPRRLVPAASPTSRSTTATSSWKAWRP